MTTSMIILKTSEIMPQVPEFQRLTDIKRVNDIFLSLQEDLLADKQIVLPGCIILAKTKKTTWIIDGMHRLEVYRRVLNELKIDFSVHCHEIWVDTEDDAHALFNKVNDTRPLPHMPTGVSVNIVKCVVEHFAAAYPKIFSNSKSGKCHRPHIHFNGFQEALARALIRHPNLNDTDVIIHISDFNAKSESVIPSYDFKKFDSDVKTKGGFYLGIIPNYTWLDMIFNNKTLPSKRYTIPLSIRKKVWEIDHGSACEGPCYLCNSLIHILAFHCGHDVAVSKGGETSIENMHAICSMCNSSMGTRTMDEMKNIIKIIQL